MNKINQPVVEFNSRASNLICDRLYPSHPDSLPMLTRITTIVGLILLTIVPLMSIETSSAPACNIIVSESNIPLQTNVEVKVKLVLSNPIHQPIANQSVLVESYERAVCVTFPCPQNEKEWTGRTNDRGELSISPGIIQSSTIIRVKGFQPKELSSKEFEQFQSSDRHDAQNVRLSILLNPE
jgi:hypothetical protein